MQSEVVGSLVVPPPDPILTANLYCDARLDELIGEVIAPFWRELKALTGEGSWHLWILRYARRGEHLKIRLHGPDEQRAMARDLLESRAGRYFAALGAPEEGTPRKISMKSPPIDADDQVEGAHPDRALLWTGYRRSHVSLGGEPFLLDDCYVSLFVRCLADGCERVLAALSPEGSAAAPPGARPGILLKLLTGGLAGPDLAARRAEYLAYHRDWLIRFTLLGRQADPDKGVEVIGQFDRRLEPMAARMEALRKLLEREWREDGEPAETAWRRSLAELLRHGRALCRSVDYHIDPFAGDPAFVCLFKALHAVANQLGVSILDEAFVHHMLLRAAEMALEPLAAGSTVGARA
jgi:hypothetical protein